MVRSNSSWVVVSLGSQCGQTDMPENITLVGGKKTILFIYNFLDKFIQLSLTIFPFPILKKYLRRLLYVIHT